MKKKLISIMLALVLMLVPVTIVRAEETIEVQVSNILYEYTVTVDTSLAESDFTLKIVPAAGGTPIYLDEIHSTATEADANGLYHHEFSGFNLRKSTPQGAYKAVVNGALGARGEAPLQVAAKTDKIALYQSMKTASAIEAAEPATADAGSWAKILYDGYHTTHAVDFPLGNYFAISKELRLKIDTCMDALVLEDLPLVTDENIKDFEKEFKPEMARLLKVVELVTAPNKDAFATAVESYSGAEDLDLDLRYYQNGETPEIGVVKLAPEKIRAKLGLLSHSFAKEEVSKAFDLASLLAAIESLGDAAVTNALEYYDGKCVALTPPESPLTADEKNSVSLKMKTANTENPFTSDIDVQNAYTAAVQEVIEGRPQETPGGEFGNVITPGPGVTITGPGGGEAPEKPVEPTKPTTSFSDLDEASWAKTAIEALATKGVLAGKGDGKFYPNDTVTREEFVKIIVEAIGIHKEDAKATFSDVASNRWSYSYIASAHKAGIIQGTSDSDFSPSGQMSRQDMAVIMKRVADLLGITLKKNNTTFSDDASIAGYAKDAVKALSGSGIINGVGDNMFSPRTTVTRAQAAKIVYELLAYGGIN